MICYNSCLFCYLLIGLVLWVCCWFWLVGSLLLLGWLFELFNLLCDYCCMVFWFELVCLFMVLWFDYGCACVFSLVWLVLLVCYCLLLIVMLSFVLLLIGCLRLLMLIVDCLRFGWDCCLLILFVCVLIVFGFGFWLLCLFDCLCWVLVDCVTSGALLCWISVFAGMVCE